MLVYIGIYVLSVLLAYCYSISKEKSTEVVFRVLLFCILFLPAALRYNIGTDYKNYYTLIRYDVNFVFHRYSGFEKGWLPLLFLIKKTGIDIHVFFVVTSFFTLIFIFKLLEKKDAVYFIIVYVSTLYLESYNIARQMFAVSMATYGLKLFFEKNKKGLFFILLSILFHSSMVFLVIVLPVLIWVEKKYITQKQFIVFFLVVVVFFHVINVPQIAFSLLLQTAFGSTSRYLTDSLYGGKTQMGSGLGVLLKEMTIIPFLFFAMPKTTDNKKNRGYGQNCLMMIILYITYLFSTQITIFNRFPYIFSTYELCSLHCLYYSRSRYRKIGLYLLVGIFIISFFVNLIKNPSSANSGLGITPYQSIFER